MYNIEQLIEAVNKSFSYNETMHNLQINRSGGNYKKIKKDITNNNIDISHFLTRDQIIKKAIEKGTISLNNILVKDSTYHHNVNLKQKLYKAGLKQPVCECCGINNIWNGKELSLHLDHINGINNDNRLENLRILCPNCHSQTETYAGRNKIKKQKIKPNQLKKLQIKEKIYTSGIDFKQYGWGAKLSKILGFSPAYCLKLVKKLTPELINAGIV